MAQLLEAVAAFLRADEWPAVRLPNQTALALRFSGDHGAWDCRAHTYEDRGQVAFYSIGPLVVPPERYAAMGEFVNRANNGLVIGNFEIDDGNGQVRFKTSLDVEGEELHTRLIKHLVYANVLTMDRYLPGLEAVLQQGMAPADAIALVEQAPRRHRQV